MQGTSISLNQAMPSNDLPIFTCQTCNAHVLAMTESGLCSVSYDGKAEDRGRRNSSSVAQDRSFRNGSPACCILIKIGILVGLVTR